MSVERIDYSSDEEFRQAQSDEGEEYARQEAERQEAEAQQDAQGETVSMLEKALVETRKQFQGIPITEVAHIIAQVFDRAELNQLVKELSNMPTETTPAPPKKEEFDLPF